MRPTPSIAPEINSVADPSPCSPSGSTATAVSRARRLLAELPVGGHLPAMHIQTPPSAPERRCGARAAEEWPSYGTPTSRQRGLRLVLAGSLGGSQARLRLQVATWPSPAAPRRSVSRPRRLAVEVSSGLACTTAPDSFLPTCPPSSTLVCQPAAQRLGCPLAARCAALPGPAGASRTLLWRLAPQPHASRQAHRSRRQIVWPSQLALQPHSRHWLRRQLAGGFALRLRVIT